MLAGFSHHTRRLSGQGLGGARTTKKNQNRILPDRLLWRQVTRLPKFPNQEFRIHCSWQSNIHSSLTVTNKWGGKKDIISAHLTASTFWQQKAAGSTCWKSGSVEASPSVQRKKCSLDLAVRIGACPCPNFVRGLISLLDLTTQIMKQVQVRRNAWIRPHSRSAVKTAASGSIGLKPSSICSNKRLIFKQIPAFFCYTSLVGTWKRWQLTEPHHFRG